MAHTCVFVPSSSLDTLLAASYIIEYKYLKTKWDRLALSSDQTAILPPASTDMVILCVACCTQWAECEKIEQVHIAGPNLADSTTCQRTTATTYTTIRSMMLLVMNRYFSVSWAHASSVSLIYIYRTRWWSSFVWLFGRAEASPSTE